MTLLAQAPGDFARRSFHRRRFHPIIVAAWLCEAQRESQSKIASASHTVRRLHLFCFRDVLLLPERMNDKQHHGNRDAGIRYIKGRPRMRVADVQIEKKKINYVTVKKAIGKISQDSGQKKRKRKVAPNIGCARSQEKDQNNDKRDG